MEKNFPNVLIYGNERLVDRNPEIRAAGNLTSFGDKVADCLFISEREPYGYVKRYLKSNIYPIGHSTQLPSRVNDPCIGANLCNGISTFPSEPVVDLIYPPEISRLENIRNEIIEQNAYPNRKMSNVGRVPRINIPENVKVCEKACGKVIKSDSTVNELLHYRPELMTSRDRKDEEIKLNRHYNEHFNPNFNFGNDQRMHFEDGRIMKNILNENSLHEKFFSVPFQLEDFRLRNSSKLGEVLEPNCDTGIALIDRNFTFGQRKLSESIGGILNTKNNENLRTEELLKNIFTKITQNDSKDFDQFLSICSYFDKAKNGRILIEDLKVACRDSKIPITRAEFNNLLEYCDLITPTNTVDYVKFYKIINPKEQISPIETETFDRELIESSKKMGKIEIPTTKSSQSDKCPRIELNNDDQQSPIDPLTMKIDRIVTEVNAKSKKSTLSDIDSDVTEFDNKKFRTFGLPLLRSEHPPPAKIHRLGDLTNYGEDSDAFACLYPSIYTENGVTKRDMLKPRPKNELQRIFKNVYPNLSNEQFDTLWQTAVKRSCDCRVTVEGIRRVLVDLNLN